MARGRASSAGVTGQQALADPSGEPGGDSRGTVVIRLSREPSHDPEDPDADVESVARTIALRKLTSRLALDTSLTRHSRPRRCPERRLMPYSIGKVGLVDDASFASTGSLPASNAATFHVKYSGESCKRKVLIRSAIDSALDHVDHDAELRSARELVERKRAAMNGLSRDVQYRRLAGILSRRGFDQPPRPACLTDVLAE